MTNRHERRAASKQQKPAAPRQTLGSDAQNEYLGDLSGLQNLSMTAEQTSLGSSTAQRKPRLLIRVLAKIILSPWVLRKVQHTDVERLLISFATEAGRPEVADEIIRRQVLRG